MTLRPRSFGAKLLLVFVLVVAAAQFTTSFIVWRFHSDEAHRQIEAELQQADRTFGRLVDFRKSLLARGAQTAARDYQIKQLFVSEDVATLASALASVRQTSGSDVVTAVNLSGAALASTSPAALAGDTYARLVARAVADPRPNPTATGYGFLDGQLYSLVVAAVRAPDIIAWMVIGFRIDHEFAADLKKITGVDLTFLNHEGKPLATTLPAATVRDLALARPRLGGLAGNHELVLGGETALVAFRPIPVDGQPPATLALQYSIDEKLRSARATERRLLQVTVGSLLIAGLLSLGFAGRLTRPIIELVGHTRRIARGDYRVRNTTYRADELGRLSQAFDQMATGLAERDRVRDLLDKNVSPEIAAQLLRDGAALGGEEREVTILFADLRGFTTLSEKLAPRDLLALLNRYLDGMSGAIEAHGGIIDKYIGDAIMALFGAPVTQEAAAARAIAAAIAMAEALVALNAELAAEGRPPLAMGVGINTARVVAGNIGSHRRLNYSVIGDGVNVAARLQSLTRTPEYHTNIIVSAATVAAAPSASAYRALGPVRVKGRAEPVEVFAVDG